MAAENVVNAFENGLKKKEKHDETDGVAYWYRGNKICWKEGEDLCVNTCGWMTNTTKDRLCKLGFRVQQVKGKWYLEGKYWDGKAINVNTFLNEKQKSSIFA